MKVLVATGTMKAKKFTRLFKILDELCEEGILDGSQMTAQVGPENYQSPYYKCFDMIPDDQFKALIDSVDLVICHSGTGIVTSSVKKEKKVIIFPRRLEFDEHLDDNQIELAESFSSQGFAMIAHNKEDLKNCILNVGDFVPKKFISNSSQINQMLIDFIDANA